MLDAAGIDHAELPRDIRIRDNGNLRYIFNHGPDAINVSRFVGENRLVLGERSLPQCGVAICEIA